MNRSLTLKLTLAFILVAFITAGLVAVFIRVTSANRLTRLLVDQQRDRLEEVLTIYYSSVGSWEGVEENWREILFFSSRRPGAFNEEIPLARSPWWPANREFGIGSPERIAFGLANAQGIVLVAVGQDRPVGSTLTWRQIRSGEPVTLGGQTVGIILTASDSPALSRSENVFLLRTTQALLLAMLAALGVALVLGVLLARSLTRPLQDLTDAAQNIAEGKLDQQVSVHSTDEIGQLAAAFNRMSQEVARETQLRRQMTADIAHDLRTPLTVIGGYVESMREGVLPPTPERLTLIYNEIERLQNLVNDLRMLSQADAGELPLNPQAVAPIDLLEQAAQIFQNIAGQHGIAMKVEGPRHAGAIYVDEARMLQVLQNLISNALRYTQPGGEIVLFANNLPGKVQVGVRDNGSGIPAEVLPHIFHRFKRAESSRHTENSESGLGLSIVKAIVEAQNGRVWAESTEGRGTTVFMEFTAAQAA